MGQFSNIYLKDTIEILGRIDSTEIEAVAGVLRRTRDRGGRLFVCGSGGGAGHASHAVCDFRKLGDFEAYCVSDNVSELTARTNDDGWETSYCNWLKTSRIDSDDCLMVFSVGGGSVEPPVSINLVNAVQTAADAGAEIVGIVGRKGGVVRALATASVLIPIGNPQLTTPHVEGLQSVIWHLLVSHPEISVNSTRWESLDNFPKP